MLFNILSGNFKEAILSLLLTMPIILFSLSLHETAHGWVAKLCGDRTAYNMGRLTLNPKRHFDLIGFLCMLVFGFGWAKPVPINSRNFKNPKRGMALSAAAGPVSNLLLGIVNGFFAGIAYYFYFVASKNPSRILYVLFLFFYLGTQINLLFAFFNLIPIPPFDGSRLALVFLPSKAYFGIMRYERQIMFGILIVLLALSRLGFSPFSWVAEKCSDAVIGGTVKLLNTLL